MTATVDLPALPTSEVELIDRASALIRAGWTRGNFHRNRQGKDLYCLLGALEKAATGGRLKAGTDPEILYRRVTDRMRTILRRRDGMRSSALYRFNDEAKSKHAVLALLAAARQEAADG